MQTESTYCSTCGSLVPRGRLTCDTCGGRSPALPRATAPLRAPFRDAPAGLGLCPRCTYRGEGLPYFSRGSHVAALVGATVITAGAMGAGGIVYYVMRRDHRVCPRCGEGWGRYGERGLARAATAAATAAPLPVAGAASSKQAWAVLLFVLAVILVVGGIAGGGVAPLLLGGAAAGGGVMLQRAAQSEREARRAALLSSLQLPVLKLASDRGGRLTVTEVAAELGWTLRRAEKVLQSLDDGFRVDSEVTDEGLIVYKFRELLHGPDRRPELPG